MFKITIDNEEVLCDKDFTIKEEMLNTSSVILNNVFPKTWEQDKDYVSRFYYPKDYSKCKIFEETIHPADPGITIENTSMSINYDSSKKWDYFLKGQTTQDGTPTPTSPQPINITTGRQVVSVSDGNTTNDYEINLGKNLLPFPYVDNSKTLNGITYTVNNDGSITCNGTATANSTFTLCNQTTSGIRDLLLNNACYLSGCPSGGSSSTYRLQLYGWNTSGGGSLVDYGNGVSLSIFVNETKNFNISIFIANGTTVNDLTFYPMLEKGSQATSYSPYKTPIYLGKIGTYQDYIFRNTTENPLYDSNLEEGQWYIHKEIGRVVLNGSENYATGSLSGFYRFQTTLSISNKELPNEAILLSNNFKGISFNNRNTQTNETCFISNGNLSFNTNVANSGSTFKTWLSTHNVEVYYVLNTPTNTLIEDEELINQLNSIELLEGLNNVSVSSLYLPFIMSLMYNYQEGYTEEDMLFCGVVENTGNISLNPRHPHYCNLQVLDFKTFLSEGETLDFVIYDKTILEAINQVIGTISEYGFVLGNVNINNQDDVIGAYSTKDKTAYDVFNYIADITQSRWTTRMIDENTVAIDFYDPTLMPQGTAIEYTQEWYCNNKILDLSFSYSSRDYRNKQVMLSGEVYSNVETTDIIVADGYQTQFNTTGKLGYISSLLLNGTPVSIITKDEYDLGYDADFIYQPGNTFFESVNLVSAGAILTITYYAIIEGREVVLNQNEINRVSEMIDRKGVVARYENRNDATTTNELQMIGQSYIKYKGSPEITLKVETLNNIWNIGERVQFTAPLEELTTEYMVKKKKINYITTQDNVFYTYELSSSFNSETEINYFDNQRSKMMGNIGTGEYISRNIDIENTANVIFYDLEVNEVEISGNSTLQSELETPLGVE